MTLQVQRLLFLSLATILLCSKVSISGEVLNVDLNAVNDEFWMMPRSLVVREEKGEESCRPAGECEECTETRKKRQEVCGKTGKIQVYKCFVEEEGMVAGCCDSAECVVLDAQSSSVSGRKRHGNHHQNHFQELPKDKSR